ncbi:hypothetical protein [Rhodococcoides fascians]|uniref:hypothetical protein n=1 Tax=Rhodococcoides fascians TaxID=1828 RepID=UPI0005683AA4|nr:hypothetical protein [Rhodococcus fascians]
MPSLRHLSLAPLAAVACALAAAAPASALPGPENFADVPARTSISFEHSPSGLRVGTANENDARPGLSTVKLYLADYALRHGDGSAGDRDLAARMIQSSDDGAASALDSKYPNAIDATAAEFGLPSTSRGGFWGSSYTSTADTVRFLEAKKRTDPASPILGWMNSSSPVATDGTQQDWGTGELADVTGTKWGWADDASSVVASASIGDGFSVAANTYGSAAAQTDDVLGALGGIDLSPGVVAPPAAPTLEQFLEMFGP